MLNAQHAVRTFDEAPALAVSPAPALIAEREVAFGTGIARQALRHAFRHLEWRLDNGSSPRQQA
jgi:hypothetical protein